MKGVVLFLLSGPPGIDEKFYKQLLVEPGLPKEEEDFSECRFSPFSFFLRHPEAGLGRLCKQVCQRLTEYKVAIVQDEQGDIPLSEEIGKAVYTRWRKVQQQQLQHVELTVVKYVFTVTDFALCRQEMLRELGIALRKFELSKDSLPKASLSKQVLCQQLAQQLYTQAVFVSAWETSENREEIMSLAQQHGYNSLPVCSPPAHHSFKEVTSPTAWVLFLSRSTSNRIVAATKEQLDTLVEWIPRESILVVLDDLVYAENATTTNNNMTDHTRWLGNRLKQKTNVVGLHLWDGLWRNAENLFEAGYIFMSSLLSCSSMVALAIIEEQHGLVDPVFTPTISLESIFQGRESNIWKYLSVNWNIDWNNFVWEFPYLDKLLDNWYLEHQGKFIFEMCCCLSESKRLQTEKYSEPKKELDNLVKMDPACRSLLDEDCIRQYANFHPKLVENAQQLLGKHRIQVLFPSSYEAECIMEASQRGSYYHVSFSIEDKYPLALKSTHCDCPYFVQQSNKAQQNNFVFCKHILALMMRVYQLITEQQLSPMESDKEKHDAVETPPVEKVETSHTLQSFHLDDMMTSEPQNDNPRVVFVPPTEPRKLPEFIKPSLVNRNEKQKKKKKLVLHENSDHTESETSDLNSPVVSVPTNHQDNDQEQHDHPSNLFYKLLFGDASDEEEEPKSMKAVSYESTHSGKDSTSFLSVAASTTDNQKTQISDHSIPSSSNTNMSASKEKKQPIQSNDDSLEEFLHMDKKPKRSIRDKLKQV